MKNIISEYCRVQKLFKKLKTDEHRKRIYEDDLEWWVLGAFKQICNKEKILFPDFAEKLEENNIDSKNCRYEKVFQINPSGKAAVSLFPFLYVIRPELRDGTTMIDRCFFNNYDENHKY